MLIDPFFDYVAKSIVENPLFESLQNYIAHSNYTVYDHSLDVAVRCYKYALEKNFKNVDLASLIRGALLHDFYLYDWHHHHEGHMLHGLRHPGFAVRNASKAFNLSKKEKNIIHAHMFPALPFVIPFYKESRIIIKMDRRSAYFETFSVKSVSLNEKEAVK